MTDGGPTNGEFLQEGIAVAGLGGRRGASGAILDEAAFTQVVADRIKSLGLGVKVTVKGPLTVELAGSDKTATMSLDNGYVDYKSAPDDLDAVAGGFVDTAKSIFSPAPAKAASSLLPVVRDLEFISVMQTNTREKSEGAHQGDELAVLPLFGELGLVFAFKLRHIDSIRDMAGHRPTRVEA